MREREQLCVSSSVAQCMCYVVLLIQKEFKKELECEKAVYTSFVRHIGDKIFEIANL